MKIFIEIPDPTTTLPMRRVHTFTRVMNDINMDDAESVNGRKCLTKREGLKTPCYRRLRRLCGCENEMGEFGLSANSVIVDRVRIVDL